MKYRRLKTLFRIVLLSFTVLFLFPSSALAENNSEGEDTGDTGKELETEIDRQMGGYNFSQWQEFISDTSGDYASLWQNVNLSDFIHQIVSGDSIADGTSLMDRIGNSVLGAIKSNITLLLSIIGITLLIGIVQSMYGDEENTKDLREIVSFICYGIIICMMLAKFSSIAAESRNAISRIADFEEIASPVLITMLTAVGGVSSSTVYAPLSAVLSGTVITVMDSVVIPVILVGGVFGILDNITGRVRLKQLCTLCKTATKWIIGIVTTIYMGLVTIQGISAAAYDGISVRTAKFALSQLVPMVGNMVSGSMDTVLGCGILIKNAAGITAIVVAASLALSQIVKVLGIMFVCRIASALCAPIAQSKLCGMLDAIADSCTYLAAVIIAVAAMFAITIGFIVATGNTVITGG